MQKIHRANGISSVLGHWRSLLLGLTLIAIGYYGFAIRVDWWLFQLHSGRIVRDASEVTGRMKASGLAFSELGVVRYGNDAWTINVLTRPAADSRGTLCVFGGLHGNEPAGVEAALKLAVDLGKNPALYPRVGFLIVPLVNPAGWVHDLRHNGVNKDVARSFVQGTTQESDLVKSLLAREHCDMLVDLHEDRAHRAVYLLSYGDEPAHATAKALARRIEAAGFALNTSAPDGVYHFTPSQYSEIERTTLSQFAQQSGVPQTFIAETPKRLALEDRMAVHRLVLDGLAQQMAGQ